MEYFADNPENSTKNFIDDIMSEKLGGISNAERYYEMSDLYFQIDKIPDAAKEISKITSSITDYSILRRWQYLGNFLNSYYWEIVQGGNIDTMIPSNGDRPDEWDDEIKQKA